MDIRLIALDIDDTLVDHSSIIPQRSLNALRKAQEQGVEIHIRKTLRSGYKKGFS